MVTCICCLVFGLTTVDSRAYVLMLVYGEIRHWIKVGLFGINLILLCVSQKNSI